MAEIVVTEGFDGGTVSAHAGDTVKVQLQENPTTGYRWTVGHVDARILTLIDDVFYPGGQGTGGGGLRVFQFAAKGSASLQFELSRSWEPGRPTKSFHVTVQVH